MARKQGGALSAPLVKPRRLLKPDPKLTYQIRLTCGLTAAMLCAGEQHMTEALRDPVLRKTLRQLAEDMADLVGDTLEAINRRRAEEQKNGGVQ
jgi:predicted metal-dependent phosphoesterase TrpH